jgi:6,7-dimethyl-8-ribityllumazine synthase
LHTELKVAIIQARWNPTICGSLSDGAKETMIKTLGMKPDNVIHEFVSGSYELPHAAKVMLDHVDAVICIGCLVKGATMHFEYICEAVRINYFWE